MLNLFNNFYIMPANMGYFIKSHNFYSSVKPEGDLVKVSFGELPKAKMLGEGINLTDCFPDGIEKAMSESNDKITVLYADSDSYKEVISRFLKTAFPSISDEMAKKFFTFFGSSLKMISHNYYLISLVDYSLPYNINDLMENYFDNIEIDMSKVEPFDVSLDELGLDWLLYDSLLSGKNNKNLTKPLNEAYKMALDNEINGVRGISDYHNLSIPDSRLEAAKVIGENVRNNVTLCKDIFENGKLRTAASIVSSLKNGDYLNFFQHRIEYDRSNSYLSLLALNGNKGLVELPSIGD